MGLLFVFEGIDRCGKSSQIKILQEFLCKNFPAKSIKCLSFPERSSPTGKLIDDFLKHKIQLNDQAVHLLFSANRWEFEESMVDFLKGPESILLLDRYFYSGIAYSVAKGLDFGWCRAMDEGLPQPDAVFYLDADPERITSRAGYGDERFERLAFQNKVREAFLRLKNGPNWCTIDTTNAWIEEVAANIRSVVRTQFLADE